MNQESLESELHAQGRVVAVDGKTAWVEIEPPTSGCMGCAAKSSCHGSALQRLVKRWQTCVPAAHDHALQTHDQVVVAMSLKAFYLATFALYFIPIFLLVVGMLLSVPVVSFWQLSPYADGLAAIGAAFGLVLGIGINRLIMARQFGNGLFQLNVIGIAEKDVAG